MCANPKSGQYTAKIQTKCAVILQTEVRLTMKITHAVQGGISLTDLTM